MRPGTQISSVPEGGAVFATTRWSIVLRAGDNTSPEAEAALARLYQTYRYPLYAYLRRQGRPHEAAQDIVQDLFLRLKQKEQLSSVEREKGRFRSYLLAAVNHLVANEWQKSQRQKRGGGQIPLSLDDLQAEQRYDLEPADIQTPEALFERRWALALLEQVMLRLEEEWRAADKTEAFEIMRAFLSGDQDAPAYAEAGTRLGMSEGAARVAVHRLRQRYRELLRDEIAQTVATTGDVEDELRHLLLALRG
jgi:RNA polymerase sigma factor (sigma-70 family)